ncbi:fluoroquinolone export ABC transporter permease subunit [Halosimplex amylolyticum]|uniref:fluoroquinolone export ABC transporter permease subunit n=1 Tax=Halosimplex amylolyticum TaxID=3396616 RepID=UPI003F562016
MERQEDDCTDDAGDGIGVALADPTLGLPLFDVRADEREFLLAFGLPFLFRVLPLQPVEFVFSDPSLLGFYFVAALVLFEKGEGVLDALPTSPLSTRAYLWSKAISLTLLALLATTAITALGYGVDLRWAPLLASVGLTSLLFVFVGFVAVARFDSINAYFMTALAYTSVLCAPVLELVGFVETPLFYLLPAKPSLVLLEAAVGSVPAIELAYAVGYLVAATGVASISARRSFDRHVVADVAAPGTDRPPVGSGVGTGGGPVLSLAVADLKNWLRDPLLVYIGLAPVLLGVVARFGIPVAERSLAGTVELSAYYPELAAALFLFGPNIIGFAVGFLILEDREQGTVVALALTPLGERGYLAYRLVVTVALSIAAAAVVVPLSGVVSVSLPSLFATAVVAGLYGPITALLLSGLAANTVEGIAVSKFLGFLVVIPVAAIAAVPPPWQHVAGVFPAYWPALALTSAADGTGSLPVALAVGIAVQTGSLAVLVRQFLRQ